MDIALAVYAYSLGLAAAFNPCGFALLPAYLAYFLKIEPAQASIPAQVGNTPQASIPAQTSDTPQASATDHSMRTVLRALTVGGALTLGFISVFAGFGLLFATVVSQGFVLKNIGYVTIIIGAVLALTGATMFVLALSGKSLSLPLPRLNRGGQSSNLGSVFMFGVSYATVSMSCTMPLFISTVSATFTDNGFWNGVTIFVLYSLGMGSVITFLTLALALAQNKVVTVMRRALRWIPIVSTAVMTLVGVYLINYGWWELRILNGEIVDNIAVSWFEAAQRNISQWIAQVTPVKLGIFSSLCITGAVLAAWTKTLASRSIRISAVSTYLTIWIAVEAVNRGEFAVLPIIRLTLSLFGSG